MYILRLLKLWIFNNSHKSVLLSILTNYILHNAIQMKWIHPEGIICYEIVNLHSYNYLQQLIKTN